jgi:hypothetical protein
MDLEGLREGHPVPAHEGDYCVMVHVQKIQGLSLEHLRGKMCMCLGFRGLGA